ncbi:MAG: hypothetical protein Q7S19_04015 [bacterium]|nr:hypothetical protein [bacterium]
MSEGAKFLKKNFDLHKSPEVEAAAKRTEVKTGKKVPQDPEARIKNYFDRLENIITPYPLEGHPDFDRKERNIEMLKRPLFAKFVTKPEDIPESYWKSQEKILRERGQSADWENASEKDKEKIKIESAKTLLADQQSSLEEWADYLTTDDSKYIPDYLKYWVFRSTLGLEEYNKEERRLPKRSKGSVKKFPDINQEALAYVVDAVVKKYKGEGPNFEYDIQPEEREKFNEYLKQESFGKMYAWANELISPILEHLLKIKEGEWKKHKKGGDSAQLAKSIRGKGTGWCTAGENTARTQLNAGDFYVYYSLDDEQQPTIPRIAIRMEGSNIAEVRGIAYKQNLDPYMADILKDKLPEFADGEKYLKKDADMKRLTEVDKKSKSKEPLSKDDLTFLYEIDNKIEGFGYQRDPRIKEILAIRNPREDAPIVFGCALDEIAWNQKEITGKTKSYIGPLFPGVFKLPIEHIQTYFPEGKVQKYEVDLGGKTKDELKAELKKQKINISPYTDDLLESKDFFISPEPENAKLIRLTVKDLGYPGGATTDQIYAKAAEYGLELCPPEVGPALRLAYKGDDWMLIAMKQITDRDGGPDVFDLFRSGAGLWLHGRRAGPAVRWNADRQFVFRIRKSEA